MPATSQRKVAVSYSWKEEREGAGAGAVEAFCSQLREAGVEVIRDVDHLKPGESIRQFMRDIGAADFLCLFLSDGYLRSANCMYELLVAWQRSRDNPDTFRQRVKCWVMPGAGDVRSLAGRAGYLSHWHAQRAEVEPLIRQHAAEGLSGASLDEYRRIKEIGDQVDEMLAHFADTLSPGSAEAFTAWIRDQFPAATGDAALADVYRHTTAEVEVLLNGNQRLREFLAAYTPGLIRQEAGRWRLAPGIGGGSFDATPHLKAISRGLRGFSGSPVDWSDLEAVVGGLMVLAVNRPGCSRSAGSCAPAPRSIRPRRPTCRWAAASAPTSCTWSPRPWPTGRPACTTSLASRKPTPASCRPRPPCSGASPNRMSKPS